MSARAASRIAGLVLLFLLCVPVHIMAKALLGRSRWPPRFLAASAWIIGARVEIEGQAKGKHILLVANHTSWLDILLLGGSLNSAFVSKDNLGHKLIHWLADQNGTIYVRRTHVRSAKEQAQALAAALERGKPVTVFPEGTTGPGTDLLPFRSTLLEAANYASRKVKIVPVAIDYGKARAEFGWSGNEPGKDNVLRLLGRPGKVRVKLKLLAPLDPSLDRKALSRNAREAIAQSLGLTLKHHSPIGAEK